MTPGSISIEEGGAAAPPSRALYVKYALDGSVAPSAYTDVPDGAPFGGLPTYASPEAAQQDHNFKAGWFWVDPVMYLAAFVAAQAPKDTNPKTVYGEAKPSLSLIPGPALIEVAMAMREGRTKYGSMNWRDDPVSSTTYADAALRHLFQWLDGEDRCPKSGALHLAHLAANAMILIDASLQSTLIDDRPPAGTTSAAIDRNTRPIKGVSVEETPDGR